MAAVILFRVMCVSDGSIAYVGQVRFFNLFIVGFVHCITYSHHYS